MDFDDQVLENGLLIVTGSSVRAEDADRPLAYELKDVIERRQDGDRYGRKVVVLSDLWYLNSEQLHRMPLISIGGPKVNAVSSYLLSRLPNVLLVENRLVIQMDMHLRDLRSCVWGVNQELTANAVEIFISRDYLDRFLDAAAVGLV